MRAEALHVLTDADFSILDFEEELGQTDATLAHAIERLFSYAAQQKGLLTEEMGAASQSDIA